MQDGRFGVQEIRRLYSAVYSGIPSEKKLQFSDSMRIKIDFPGGNATVRFGTGDRLRGAVDASRLEINFDGTKYVLTWLDRKHDPYTRAIKINGKSGGAMTQEDYTTLAQKLGISI